jgi:putative heme-binding domain-containing protein
MRRLSLLLIGSILTSAGFARADDLPGRPRKVVLIAGPLDKSHPPGTHEYEKSVRLLQHCLDTSSNLKGIRSELHVGGWPADARTLDDADTIVLVASGSDRKVEDHPFLVGDRLKVLAKQMERGCGLVLIHWCIFLPKDKAGPQALEWVGGYFDYESGPKPTGWYSKIQTAKRRVLPASRAHPICRGIEPFELREEFYYNIRFRERDRRLVPILTTSLPNEKDEQTIAWAVERRDGGRGFGFTGGHFFDNWQVANFRKMVLNAIAWTARAEVPKGGVESRSPSEEELQKIKPKSPSAPSNKPGPSSRSELDYQPIDPRLKAILLHRSEDESYVAIKADTQGRLFVGGREALFVFEPNARGGYEPPRELYRFPPDSWIAGIELRGNDLYVLTAAALYVIPQGRVQRDGLKPKRLLWGLPLDLHVSFHCLAWGPEGDLYLNHGDPLLNYGDWSRPDHWGHWTLFTAAGLEQPYTGQGAVLRMKTDGSKLRVVARGLRGPFGLTFDRHWNLFTNDNDHESRPDLYTPARLLHVTPYADFAWPRGWEATKLPDRADLLATMLPTPGRGVPVGTCYYDDLFLPAEYRNNLLQARWDRLAIQRHPLRRRGASFAAAELPFLEGKQQARPVNVTVGRGGRLFAAISYMAGNEASPHYVSDLVMITRADDPPEHRFEPYDVVAAAPAKLWSELSSGSWDRRYAAHVELLRRGGEHQPDAVRRLGAIQDDDPAVFHLPWLAAAGGRADSVPALTRLAAHRNSVVRLQAIRALAEIRPAQKARDVVEKALDDSDPCVQLAALAAFFQVEGELPWPAIVKLAESSDTYLRQTAARLLACRASLAQIEKWTEDRDAAVRLAAVLAAGFRLTVPPSDQPPPKQVRLSLPPDNAFFKSKIPYADGSVDLRTTGRAGSYTIAEAWKAVPHTAEQTALAKLLRHVLLIDESDPVLLQAAYFLSLLRDEEMEPLVEATFESVHVKRVADSPLRPIPKVWIAGPFDDGRQGFKRALGPELGAVDLSAEYETPGGKVRWQELTKGQQEERDDFTFTERNRPGERASTYVFFRLHSATRQRGLFAVGVPADLKVWHNGRKVFERRQENFNIMVLDLQPGSNDLLLRIRDSQGFDLQLKAREPVVAVLPERLTVADLAQRLKDAARSGKDAIPAQFLNLDWSQEVRKGSAAEGRKLFGALNCAKCHAIATDQAGAGAPSLAEAGKRFTVPHLVESILLPSKQVAEPFRATTIATRQGRQFTGLVVSETADTLELLLLDATRQTIAKKDVEARELTAASPMPAGLVKTPKELRDLLAYLLSDKPLPP